MTVLMIHPRICNNHSYERFYPTFVLGGKPFPRLNTEHIAFTVAPLPGSGGPRVKVTADQLVDIPLYRIIGVSAFFANSKLDSSGKGQWIPFIRREVVPSVCCVYDIETDHTLLVRYR